MKTSVKVILVIVVILGYLIYIGSGSKVQSQQKNGQPSITTDKIEVNPENSSLEIMKTIAKNDDYSMHVYVTVRNNSDKLCQAATFQSNYYDEKHNVVGAGNGTILNLAAGQTKVVDCMAMDIQGATRYEVQIATALFQ